MLNSLTSYSFVYGKSTVSEFLQNFEKLYNIRSDVVTGSDIQFQFQNPDIFLVNTTSMLILSIVIILYAFHMEWIF